MKLPFWKRKERNNQLNEEVQAHLTLAEREAMEAGRPKEDAKVAALKEFGNVALAEEVTRDMWGWRWLRDLLQDVRYGLRMLRMNPGFTAVAVLTLALGIGANTAIFSLIDAVMLRMLPVQKPEELVLISIPSGQTQFFSNAIWEQIRGRQDVFSAIFAWFPTEFDMAQSGESHYGEALYASGDFFNTLGVRPAAGRLLTTSDDVRGCPGTAVLSYGYWQAHYGGAPNAVGSTLNLKKHSFQIIGVAAPGFFGVNVGQQFDVAIPLCSQAIFNGANSVLDRPTPWLHVMGRLKPGISQDQANARLKVLSTEIYSAIDPEYWKPDVQKDYTKYPFVATSLPTGLSELREGYDKPLKILMVVVSLVLLIACANIASLMLARSATRQREIAVRLALGASRFRLIRQLLTECILLSCTGALLGFLFARWGSALLVHFISTTSDPVFLQLSPDIRILGFAASIAVLTGLLFGALPAFRSTKVSLADAMKGSHSSEIGGESRFHGGRWIVASQVALSLILMIVAGLFLRSFRNLLTIDFGFDPNNVLIVYTHGAGISENERPVLDQQILNRLSSLPGVISVSQSGLTPLGKESWSDSFSFDPGNSSGGDAMPSAAVNYVSPGYFATLRTPLRSGRNFEESDGADAARVAIINQTMAQKLFPHSDPIGKYVYSKYMLDLKNRPVQIIGVVKDAKYASLREINPPTIYFPLAQTGPLNATFEIRTAVRPSSLTRSAANAITGINKNISFTFQTLEKQMGDSLIQDKLLATLSGFFGGLALLLATIGLYGVLAYMVTQRRKEIGIRMALGAGRESILWLVLRDVSILLLAGVTVGVGVSLWATQFLQKMLFDLNARDTKTITLAVATLAAVALFAGYLPARRASRLNPMAILRDE